MKTFLEILGTILIFLVPIVLISLLSGLIFMLLGNLALKLFNVAFRLTFWQSYIVCLILSFFGRGFGVSFGNKND